MSVLDVTEGRGYIAKIEQHSFVDGEGVRVSMYVSGCPFLCEGCYNVAAQRFTTANPLMMKRLKQFCTTVNRTILLD